MCAVFRFHCETATARDTVDAGALSQSQSTAAAAAATAAAIPIHHDAVIRNIGAAVACVGC